MVGIAQWGFRPPLTPAGLPVPDLHDVSIEGAAAAIGSLVRVTIAIRLACRTATSPASLPNLRWRLGSAEDRALQAHCDSWRSVPFDRLRPPAVLRAQDSRRSVSATENKQLLMGGSGRRPGTIALHDGEYAYQRRNYNKERKSRNCAACEPTRPSVLADVLPFEFVFGHSVHRRGQICHRASESAVPQIEIGGSPSPTQIEVARLIGQHPSQRWRYCGGLCGEVAPCGVP